MVGVEGRLLVGWRRDFGRVEERLIRVDEGLEAVTFVGIVGETLGGMEERL